MSVSLDFNQASTLLNEIVSNATGQSYPTTPVDERDFVSVATVALNTGYDKLATAISQVLGRTIFSVRPYDRKFKTINVDEQRFGNRTRKITVLDNEFEDDERFSLVNDGSVDMYKVKKPKALETNYYGGNIYQDHITIYKDQLDTAFHSSEEFSRFISAVFQNISDRIEKVHEETARACICNFIGGLSYLDDARPMGIVHLVTSFKEMKGITGDINIFSDTYFRPFMQFAFATMQSMSEYLTERSIGFHLNLTGKDIMRHTPISKQKLFIPNMYVQNVATSVLSNTFHDDYLKKIDYETLNFFQTITQPDYINIVPAVIGADGLEVSNPEAVEVEKIFAICFDEEALGYTTINRWTQATPFNPAGGYYNQYWHFTERYWNDFTENAILYLLD